MNGEDFFNAINMIDDDLVEEAAEVGKTKRKKKTVFLSLAACLAVFVCTAVILSEFGVLPSYETAEDAVVNQGTKNETAEENVLVGGTGNTAPENANPEDSTEIYIPETAAPEIQATAPGENIDSTPSQEAVTGMDTSSPYIPEETTTEKSQEYNGNTTQQGVVFRAKIIEINGNSVTVEPLQAPESSSSDRIVFSKAKLEELDIKKGDVVIISYDGLIMETYPAQIHASSWSLAE